MTKAHQHREPLIELVEIDGRTLRVAVWAGEETPKQPKERPLFFYNGIGANIELMAPLSDFFADRDIVTFDMPGIGGSPEPVVPYRAWTIARLTAKLLDRYGYDKVDVMGVSWGGGMAQQMAFQHPKRVGKVVLVATSTGSLMVPGDLGALSKMAHPRRYMDYEYFMKSFKTLYGGEMDGADGHVSRMMAPTMRGYLYQMLAMAGWTSIPFLPFLKQKTLVMAGDKDRIVPVVNGKILAGLIPKSRLHVVEGGGHLFIVSRATEVMPVMRSFLAEPDADPAKERSGMASWFSTRFA